MPSRAKSSSDCRKKTSAVLFGSFVVQTEKPRVRAPKVSFIPWSLGCCSKRHRPLLTRP